MATRIYITDEGKVEELECVSDGQDFIADIIGNNDFDGRWGHDTGDSSFQMPRSDFEWWAEWAWREQRILDKAAEIGEQATDELARLGEVYNDLDALHDAQEKYLGLR